VADVFTDEFRTVPTAKLLARVATARADGDWRAASAEWWSCIARARERVASVVDRYVAKGWIPKSQHADAVQEALIRGARRLVENLEDLGENAFFAGMVQVAKYQCMDHAEAEMKRQMRERSLDDPAPGRDEDEQRGRYDAALAKQARNDWERSLGAHDLQRLFDDLIPQLRDPRAQEIVEADRSGGPTDDEFAERLGTSTNNVQQIRSRAYKELRGLIDR